MEEKFYAMAEPRSENAIHKAEERKMMRENKDLLLRDLCARLPYGAKIHYKTAGWEDKNHTLSPQVIDNFLIRRDVVIKPYLRPMSSMTEEEKKEYIEYAGYEIEESVNGRHYEYYLKDFCGTPDEPSVNTNGVDWLNKKMFDFRGLIPKGLALSTEVFNPYTD